MCKSSQVLTQTVIPEECERRSSLNSIWIAALHFIPLAMTCVSKSVNSYKI